MVIGIKNTHMDRIIEDKSWIKKKYRKYIIIGAILIAALSIFLFTSKVSSVNVDSDKVTIDVVYKGLFNDYIQVTGQAAPISTVYLDAVEGGRVEERLIEEGSMVKKGDIILKLSNKDLILNILNSEAQLAEKTNFLRETRLQMEQEKLSIEREIIVSSYELLSKRRTYDQNKELYKDKLIAREDLLKSEENYLVAQKTFDLMNKRQQQDSLFRSLQVLQLTANLDNMQRNLSLVKEQVNYLDVKAPLDGQLGMLDAEIGQSINRGQRIGQINVLTSFKIEADVDEHYIDRIKQGLTGYIEKEADTLLLKIRKVYPDVREGRFKIDLVFHESLPANIRTGQTYYIKLELGEPMEAIQIPRGGFFQNTGGQWIYVLDKSGKFATKRTIKVGRQNPQYYEIIEGLKPGEKVITSSYDAMGDNERVVLK
jgi:HlyD family secretion protein